MLFHASAEKSDPTCETPNAISKPNAPDAAVTEGMNDFSQSAPGSIGLRIVQRPQTAEIRVNRRGIASEKNSGQNQRGQRQRLCRSENILNQFPKLQSARVEQRQKNNQEQRDQLLHGKTDRIFLGERDGRNRSKCSEKSPATPRPESAQSPPPPRRSFRSESPGNSVQPYRNPHSGEYASRR